MNEQLETLRGSLAAAVRYLSGIIADIDAGTYTRGAAVADYDAVTGSEAFGFIADLDIYASGGDDE